MSENKSENNNIEFEITDELMRQVDLVSPSPDAIIQHVNSLVMPMIASKQIQPYHLFWFCLNRLGALAQMYSPETLPMIASIYKESIITHYGETILKLGLVKEDIKTGENNKDGLSNLGDKHSENGTNPSSPPNSRIIGLE